ncbi:MAG TPA: hypothetical protein VFN76_09920 [Candidatus Limnocylindria bacterium]|nr:hypothetical protein [Candidatus Limnocylindria bacterium]
MMPTLDRRGSEYSPARSASPRRHGIILPERNEDGTIRRTAAGAPAYPVIRCPYGHEIGWEWNTIGDTFPRCGHLLSKHQNEKTQKCNARLWILPLPQRGEPGCPWILVAEVDRAEIAYMEQQFMTPDEIVRFLGLTWGAGRAA